MKVNNRVETIFAYAAAMDNRGRKNVIHCLEKNVYIVNFDYSMILRFRLRQNEGSFDSPISFNVNDYDSSHFTFEEDPDGGRIVFHTKSGEYERKKICRADPTIPDAHKIRQVYRQLKQAGKDSPYLFYLSDECCPLLDNSLSHTEISVEGDGLVLRQRDVYSGSLVEITPKKGAGLFTVDKLPKNMRPIAVKTKDFLSLFLIKKSLEFVPAEDFIMVRDVANDFEGVISLCKYDMIIDLYKEESK